MKNNSNTIKSANSLDFIDDSSNNDIASNTTLILMAAGDSRRFCNDMPIKKQWLRIESKPLWLFVADKMCNFYPFNKVIVTASPLDIHYMRQISNYTITKGGKSRQESLQNALKNVTSKYVLVSDVARWNINKDIISRLFRAMKNNDVDCVAPRIGIFDTLIYDDKQHKKYLEREQCFRIQTPQLSKTAPLKQALMLAQTTDESSAMQEFGAKVGYIDGSEELNKLTHKEDIKQLLNYINESNSVNKPVWRVGNGIDVHGFEKGKIMKLGGVEIKSDVGFKAHSDGDVALHCIADALLGAIGAGDIGEWFPDDDEQFLNADSRELLKKVSDFARGIGFSLENLDLTILAQSPKIAPYKTAIRHSISDILQTPLECVNIKASTTENLGFIGRKEGVCAFASVSLKLTDWKDFI